MGPSLNDSLRPSSAHRWMACAAAPARELGIPEAPSAYRDEGVAAHQVAAARLLEGKAPTEYVGRVLNVEDAGEAPRTWRVDLEMAHEVQKYLDYLGGMRCAWREVEYRIPMTGILPVKGTADLALIEAGTKRLHIMDLKYGRGVKVYPAYNEQLMLYALGVLQELESLYEIDEVVLHIVQPRIDHYDAWTTTPAELQGFRNDVQAAVLRAQAPDAPATPGAHCKFCRFKAQCRELAEYNLHAISREFGDPLDAPLPVADGLTLDELGRLLESAGEIRDWLSALEARAHAEIENGGAIPGWKLVAGQGRRKWTATDEDVIALAKRKRLAIDQFMPRELASPAGLEKTLGKAKFVKLGFPLLLDKSEGKPVLAREDDRRQALTFTPVAEQFGDPLTAEADEPSLADLLA